MKEMIRTLVSIYENTKDDNTLAMNVAGMSKSSLASQICDTVTTLLRLDRELTAANADAEYYKAKVKDYEDLLSGFSADDFRGDDLQRLNALLSEMEDKYL